MPPPNWLIMFSMAACSVCQAVITLCSVAGTLLPTGSPSFSSNCT